MISFTPSFFLYAAVTLGAVGMSACVDKEERTQAFLCSVLLFASWLMHLSSWMPWSIEALWVDIFEGGRKLTMADTLTAWAFCNCVVGVLVWVLAAGELTAVSRYTMWGPLLTYLLLCGCLNDALRWVGALPRFGFYRIADILFLLEEAIILSLGAGNAFRFLGDFCDRHIHRPLSAAYSKAVTRSRE